MNTRSLRNRKLRAALCLNQNNKCAICGEILPRNFHADHKIPYCQVKITEFDNMQATCPVCNLKKGNKIMYEDMNLLKSSSFSGARTGQKGAVNSILDRFLKRFNTSTFIVATGVGKTDIARTAMVELVDQQLVSGNIIVVPNVVLVNQLNEKAEIKEWMSRWNIKPKNPLTFDKMEQFHVQLFQNNEYWIAMTSQMFCRNADHLAEFARLRLRDTGKPLALFADETHLFSDENEYGIGLKKWTAKGGVSVQGTATGYRSNGVRIPGFKYITVDQATEIIHTPGPVDPTTKKRRMDVNEVIKTTEKLEADYEYGFKRAWEDRVICKIEKHFVDVKVDIDGVEEEIKDLSPSQVQQFLTKICRDVHVIAACCKQFTKLLRRRQKMLPEIKGIVFCGNDQEKDSENDEHPKLIQKALTRIDSNLRIGIATSSDSDNAIKTISDFKAGCFDVLIVKQMGGVGLDVPSCKVELDLSSIRQPNSFVQRINRISRIYKKIKTCDYISPNDVRQQSLFDKFVTEQGGEMVNSSSVKIDEYYKDEDDGGKNRKMISIVGASYGGVVDINQDKSNANEIEAFADPLLNRYPQLQDVLSTKEIIEIAKGMDQNQLNSFKDSPVVTKDISEIREEYKSKINQLAKDYASYKYSYGSHKLEHIEAKKNIIQHGKKKAGVPLNRELKFIMEVEKLESMFLSMKQFAKLEEKPEVDQDFLNELESTMQF